MFNAVNILEALKNYIRTRGGQSAANNIAEAVNDLNSIPQGSGGGIPEAPIDDNQYARKNGDWSKVESSGGDIPDEVTNAIETGGMGYVSTELVVACDQDIVFDEVDGGKVALLPSFEFIENIVYTVSIDSEIYQSKCIFLDPEGDFKMIGNLSLAGLGDDTGEPYVIYDNGDRIGMMFNGTQSSARVYISYIGPVTHVINTEYIPTKDRGCEIRLFETAEDAVSGEGAFVNASIYTVGDSRLYVKGTFAPKEPQDNYVIYYCRISDMPDFVTDIVYNKYMFFTTRPGVVGFYSTDDQISLEGFSNEFDASVILRLRCNFKNTDSSEIRYHVTELLPSYELI